MWFDKLTTNGIHKLPFVLSLSKDLIRGSLALAGISSMWFDKLTTNGIHKLPFVLSLPLNQRFPSIGGHLQPLMSVEPHG